MSKGHSLAFLKGIGALAVLAMLVAGCSSSGSGGGGGTGLPTVTASINASGGNSANSSGGPGGVVDLTSAGTMTISQSGSVPAVALPADATALDSTVGDANDIVVAADANLSTLVCVSIDTGPAVYYVGTSNTGAVADSLIVNRGVTLTWDQILPCTDNINVTTATGQLSLIGDAAINGTIKTGTSVPGNLMDLQASGVVIVSSTGIIDGSGAAGTSSTPGGGNGVNISLYSSDCTVDVSMRVSGTVKSTGGDGYDETVVSFGGNGGNIDIGTGVCTSGVAVNGTLRTDSGVSSDPDVHPGAGSITIDAEGEVFISGTLSAKGADSGMDNAGNDIGSAGDGNAINVTSNFGNIDVTAAANLITTGGTGHGSNIFSGNILLTASNTGATLTTAGILNASGATVTSNYISQVGVPGDIVLLSDGAMTVGGNLNAAGGLGLAEQIDGAGGGTINLTSNSSTLDLKGINQINAQGGWGAADQGLGGTIFVDANTDITNQVPMVADAGTTLYTLQHSASDGGTIEIIGFGTTVNTGSLSALGGSILDGDLLGVHGGNGGYVEVDSGNGPLTNNGAITVAGGQAPTTSTYGGNGGYALLISGFNADSDPVLDSGSGTVDVCECTDIGAGDVITSSGVINADGGASLAGSAVGNGGIVAIYTFAVVDDSSIVITAPIAVLPGGADGLSGSIGIATPGTTVDAGERGLLSIDPDDITLV